MMGWIRAWNKIIREVIYHDHKLKVLMKLPPRTGVIQFTERYFIHAGYTNKLLTDEVCRIVYSDIQGAETAVPNITQNMMTFDIYVKNEEQRGLTDDGLILRTHLIAERLKYLLTKQRYLAGTGYRFRIAGDWDMGTRTSGYSRYCIAFYYMKVY